MLIVPGRSFRSWAVIAPGVLLLLFAAAAVALYVVFFAPLLYPYRGDAPAYIEAARSLLAGEPLLYSVPFGYDNERQIFRLWPPGFPVLIAAVASAGFDAGVAALWLTRLSVALLPLTAYWAIYRAVGVPIAVGAALLSFSAVGMLPYAHMVSSDPPFAVVVMLSLGFLLRGLVETRVMLSFRLLAIAGLLTALAFSIRNSGIALILAEGATIAALWLAKDGSFTRFFRHGLSFASGLGVGLLPLMIWNLAAFGTLRPYEMLPSTIGVAENLQHFAYSLVFDLLPRVRTTAGMTPVVIVLLGAGILVIVGIGIAQLRSYNLRGETRAGVSQADEPEASQRRGVFMVFAACYVLATVIVTVVARSLYEWGELIGARHVAQIDWLLATAVFSAVASWLKKSRAAMIALVLIAVCLFGFRAWYFADVYDWAAAGHSGNPPHLARVDGTAPSGGVLRPSELAFSRSAVAADFIANVPSHCDIISNTAGVIQVVYRRRARQLYGPKITMEMFADLKKSTVLIFIAAPGLDIQSLQPPSPAYRTIRDPVFVAFEPAECR